MNNIFWGLCVVINFFKTLESFSDRHMKYRIEKLLTAFGIHDAVSRSAILVKFDFDEKRYKFTMAEFIRMFHQKGLIEVICNPSNEAFKGLSEVIVHYDKLVNPKKVADAKKDEVKAKAKAKAEAEVEVEDEDKKEAKTKSKSKTKSKAKTTKAKAKKTKKEE